MSMIQCRVSYK